MYSNAGGFGIFAGSPMCGMKPTVVKLVPTLEADTELEDGSLRVVTAPREVRKLIYSSCL